MFHSQEKERNFFFFFFGSSLVRRITPVNYGEH